MILSEPPLPRVPLWPEGQRAGRTGLQGRRGGVSSEEGQRTRTAPGSHGPERAMLLGLVLRNLFKDRLVAFLVVP